MSSRYGEMTIDQLKKELRRRNARVSGRKEDLVDRLEAYERNQNFGFGESSMQKDTFNMEKPQDSTYRDINTSSQVPIVTMSNVSTYLKLFDQQLGGKIEAMYFGKFLKSIRHSPDGKDTYILARVCAEMKKTLVYSVDVKIDDHGIVQESQCECGAGMGPNAHCKHVMLTLLALTKTKEGIVTKDTCTQQLQTFHHAKKYSGSPVKTESLSLRSDGSLEYLRDFDPRPESLRNRVEYPGHFRSVWVNNRTPNLAIRQLYAPANIYALCRDHDYLEETPEDLFLQQIGVRSISASEQAAIEQQTRGQSTNKLWFQERTKRLQASNFGRICKATEKTDFEKYDAYCFQVQGTMFCTERQWCDFIVWTRVDMKIIRIQRDESFIRDMLSKLEKFFTMFFKPCLLKNFLYKNTDSRMFKY